MDNVVHEIVEAMEEQGKTTIEDFDMVSYETDRPMNLIVMPISEKSIGLLENKSNVPVVSREDLSI